MPIAIRTRKVDDGKHKVVAYHDNPENLSEEELEDVTIVDSLPEKEDKKGKSSQIYYNPEKDKLWVEYEEKQGQYEYEVRQVVEALNEINDTLESIEQKIDSRF